MSNKQQPNAEQRHQELQKDIEAFLKSGGTIKKVKAGITGEKHAWLSGKDDSKRPCTIVNLPNHIAPGFTI